MGRVIITIDEIVAGRGLESDKATTPPALNVRCGNGIHYGNDNAVAVNNGLGLNFSPDNELQVANEDLAGWGLLPGEGSQLDIDTEVDDLQRSTFTVVTDSKFQMDGYRLVFCVTYTTFIVHKNRIGLVRNITKGDSVTECQPLNINGYTLDADNVDPPKTSVPSFYK